MASAEGVRGGGPAHLCLGPGFSGWLMGEEKLHAELGIGAAALRKGRAALGNESVGSGARKEQVLAASWAEGPNRLHCRPGCAPTNVR